MASVARQIHRKKSSKLTSHGFWREQPSSSKYATISLGKDYILNRPALFVHHGAPEMCVWLGARGTRQVLVFSFAKPHII